MVTHSTGYSRVSLVAIGVISNSTTVLFFSSQSGSRTWTYWISEAVRIPHASSLITSVQQPFDGLESNMSGIQPKNDHPRSVRTSDLGQTHEVVTQIHFLIGW